MSMDQMNPSSGIYEVTQPPPQLPQLQPQPQQLSPPHAHKRAQQQQHQQRQQLGKKRGFMIDLSSMPLQILLHLNVYFFTAFWLIEIALYVYKGLILPFPDVAGTLLLEVVLIVLVAVIESLRLFFGYKGNLGERKLTLVWCIILSVPVLVAQVYLILWQTYVFRVEVILCSILFVIVALEFLLAIATVFSLQRREIN